MHFVMSGAAARTGSLIEKRDKKYKKMGRIEETNKHGISHTKTKARQ